MPDGRNSMFKDGSCPGLSLLTILIILIGTFISSYVIVTISTISLKLMTAGLGGLIFLIVLTVIKDPKSLLLAMFGFSAVLYIDITLMEASWSVSQMRGGLMLDAKDVFMGLLYFLWVRDAFVNRGAKATLKSVPLISFMLFTAWMAFTILKTDPIYYKNASFRLINHLRMIFILWYIINNARDYKSIKFLMMGVAAGLMFHSAVGIFEKVSGHTINIPILSTKGTEYGIGEGGQSWQGDRIQGATKHPNWLAKALDLFIPAFFLISIYFKKDFWYRLVLFTSAGLSSIALILTQSRSGWGALFAAMMGAFFMMAYYKKKLVQFIFISIIAAVFVLLPVMFTDNVISNRILRSDLSEYGSAYSRIPMFMIAANYIRDNPVMGVGMGMYEPLLVKYDNSTRQFVQDEIKPVHNTFLYYAAENGIPALIFLIIFLGSPIYMGLKISGSQEGYVRLVALGLVMGIFSNILILGYTIYVFRKLWEIMVPIGIIGALYIKYKSSLPEDQLDDRTFIPKYID